MLVKVASPAKINLGLEILSKLPNGYHEVDFVMQTVSLFDYVTAEQAEGSEIHVTCSKKMDCSVENNIVFKAAKVFFEFTGAKNRGINIHIEKNIPISAGLAGGSSNGAAVLLALDNIFGMNLKLYEFLKLGEKIGSDVPFCILGGTARATGTGTKLKSIAPLPDCYIIIVKPPLTVSTKEAYKKLNKFEFGTGTKIDALIKYIENQNLQDICKNLFNKFESVISEDIITDIKINLIKNGAIGTCMSGSGPTIFGIFNYEACAIKCYNKIKSIYAESFLCWPINHGVKICDKFT